ncbi:MAG: beta-N-acetylhexosaminidase [Deltaproteobacteria bacterium]|nr:beta-N-acetylhexosaminidase [Deltaproteobacteria bacterium]
MNTQDLKKLIGSLLIVGFEGLEPSESVFNFLKTWDLGGVILFKRNVESMEQVRELNRQLYASASTTPIISVDHEGGRVFRLPKPFTSFGPSLDLANLARARGDLSLLQAVGQAMAKELRLVGFNVNYAPVLDVHSEASNPIIGDRAFGSKPEEAAKAALELWKGLEAVGVRGCGKHFPGHGDTKEDSHLTLPKLTKSQEKLEACEFVPFVKAIEEGISMLMTAHVLYEALDPDYPATLSPKILQGLLRQRMAYEGLILSDDLFMQGIVDHWGLEEAAERFLRAGGDMLLLCHQESAQRRVAAHLVHLAEKDLDFRKSLEEKASRVAHLRPQLSSGFGKLHSSRVLASSAALQERILSFLEGLEAT